MYFSDNMFFFIFFSPLNFRERSKSPRRYPHNWDDDTCFFGNELTYVGFSDDIDISQIFEVSGRSKVKIQGLVTFQTWYVKAVW